MKLETIDINKINPAIYNPRKDLKPGDSEYEKLKKSITEFDMVEPLILNKRGNVLIGGHQRLKVLKEMGRTEVEVSVVDLPPAKEKALNIALNKISGEWDLPLLKDLLQEIDTGEFDIEITGFDSKKIEGLINQLHQPEDGLTDDDEVPEPKESICKLGDLWALGTHRLYCGDATVEADVAKLMAGEKADMVFTDPPYGISVVGKKGNVGGDTKQAPTTKFRSIIGDETLSDPSFLLELSAVVFIWGGNYFAHLLPVGGKWFVWDKNRPEGLSLSDCELAYSNIKGIKVQKYKCTWDGYHKEGESGTRVHPAQKPVKLLVDILTDITKANNIILDPFGGSGSTLIACEKLNRQCRMMEIDNHYCDVVINRWQNFTGKQAELQKPS